jgi:ATP-dependent Clp protease ATP-binding subunit ClpC
VVSRWTGIPVSKMLEEEITKLARMEDELQKRIIGQKEAVRKISDTIRRSRAGVSDPNRPIGSFIFLGPTGVGKTELTKAVAEFMFNDEKALVRVDMSEFMEKHSVSKIIGAPPGYVGHEDSGNLTETIRHRPYSVILFDEIEKAHPEVFNILLQVLDNGRLTDSKGRVVNFKNTVIILTSNIGAEYIDNMEKLGFYESGTDNNQYADAKKNVEKALKQNFRPEFLNRLDDIIIFDILEQDTIKKIVSLQIEEVKKRVLDKNINLKVTDAVINFLAKEGYDPHYGARPVKRVIQNRILNQLAKLIITKNLVSNDSVTVNIKGKDFSFDVKKGKKSRLYQENDVKEAVLVN